MSPRLIALLGVGSAVCGAALLLASGSSGGQAAGTCGMPGGSPVWIEYGEGSVRPDVRAVLARPGVVVATSGTSVPAYYRDRGAATVYFVLHLPELVGGPSDPEDPASIVAAADGLYARAVASTKCDTPWIALNELNQPSLATPWSAANATYRANVLALLTQLRARGARPVLLVQGNPNTAGDAATWWRQVAQTGELVYEAYYDARRISAMGPVMGNRRMRLGERNVIRQFKAIGINPASLGIMLGFHSAQTPGIGGRQGLQPTSSWLRVVKWEALQARRVAADEGLSSVWSWGWGTFGPESVDADKAAAACVYLWARDSTLCDGLAVAGTDFNSALAEGQIVLPDGVACAFAAGHVRTAAVDALAILIRNRHAALTAVFGRVALRSAAPVPNADVLAAERATIDRVFHGDRQGYLAALTRSHATLAVARDIIRDELRRRAITRQLAAQGSTQTTLGYTADREAQLVNTAICLNDELPGSGDFPRTDAREVGVVPLLAKLPYLFGDKTAPARPAVPAAAQGGVGMLSLTWEYGAEADLAGYLVYRATTSGGPYVPVGSFLGRPTYLDTAAPRGQTAYYVVKAVDTSGNVSKPSPELAAPVPA